MLPRTKQVPQSQSTPCKHLFHQRTEEQYLCFHLRTLSH